MPELVIDSLDPMLSDENQHDYCTDGKKLQISED